MGCTRTQCKRGFFNDSAGVNVGSSTTGLPNAGVASSEDKVLKHWNEVAGFTDDDPKKE